MKKNISPVVAVVAIVIVLVVLFAIYKATIGGGGKEPEKQAGEERPGGVDGPPEQGGQKAFAGGQEGMKGGGPGMRPGGQPAGGDTESADE